MVNSRHRTIIIAAVAAVFLVAAGAAFGQAVDRHRHPNLSAAQVSIERAIHRLSAAELANRGHMAGHAARAKQLLDQAYRQVGLAARAANRNR